MMAFGICRVLCMNGISFNIPSALSFHAIFFAKVFCDNDVVVFTYLVCLRLTGVSRKQTKYEKTLAFRYFEFVR